MIYQFPTFPMRASEFDESQLPGFREVREYWTSEAAKVVALDFACLNAGHPQDREGARHFTLQAHYACIVESVAMAQWLGDKVGPPAFATAYSMGLFAAVAHAGAIEFPSVLELARDVCMAAHQSASQQAWAIGAAVDFPERRLRELMAESAPDLEVTDLYGANTVLYTGPSEPVKAVLDRALAEGASATRLIPVTAPFHTSGLLIIEPILAEVLSRTRLRAPAWPILSSITQELLVTAEDIHAEICRNVSRPMNWFATLKKALSLDGGHMVESGASFTLTELARNLFPDTGNYRDFRDFQVSHG